MRVVDSGIRIKELVEGCEKVDCLMGMGYKTPLSSELQKTLNLSGLKQLTNVLHRF
jgi:hypothetical protein